MGNHSHSESNDASQLSTRSPFQPCRPVHSTNRTSLPVDARLTKILSSDSSLLVIVNGACLAICAADQPAHPTVNVLVTDPKCPMPSSATALPNGLVAFPGSRAAIRLQDMLNWGIVNHLGVSQEISENLLTGNTGDQLRHHGVSRYSDVAYLASSGVLVSILETAVPVRSQQMVPNLRLTAWKVDPLGSTERFCPSDPTSSSSAGFAGIPMVDRVLSFEQIERGNVLLSYRRDLPSQLTFPSVLHRSESSLAILNLAREKIVRTSSETSETPLNFVLLDSENERIVTSGKKTSRCRMWDARSLDLCHRFGAVFGVDGFHFGSGTRACCMASGSHTFIQGLASRQIAVWDLRKATGDPLRILDTSLEVTSLCAVSERSFAVTTEVRERGSREHYLTFWTSEGKQQGEFAEFKGRDTNWSACLVDRNQFSSFASPVSDELGFLLEMNVLQLQIRILQGEEQFLVLNCARVLLLEAT